MQLFCVTVMFRTQGAQIGLVFQSLDAADSAYANIAEARVAKVDVEVEDEYGCKADIAVADVILVVRSRLSEQLRGQSDIAFEQTHANASLQRKAQADPLLRGGPPMLSN